MRRRVVPAPTFGIASSDCSDICARSPQVCTCARRSAVWARLSNSSKGTGSSATSLIQPNLSAKRGSDVSEGAWDWAPSTWMRRRVVPAPTFGIASSDCSDICARSPQVRTCARRSAVWARLSNSSKGTGSSAATSLIQPNLSAKVVDAAGAAASLAAAVAPAPLRSRRATRGVFNTVRVLIPSLAFADEREHTAAMSVSAGAGFSAGIDLPPSSSPQDRLKIAGSKLGWWREVSKPGRSPGWTGPGSSVGQYTACGSICNPQFGGGRWLSSG